MKEVRRYMGVGSTVVGLVSYALSSSFNRLYGEWNWFKICAYIVSSSIICLAILFPKAWQHLSIFHYRAHMTFLVMASTTVYSFYLDRRMNAKPDAYGPISSAAFAMASLCMSKEVECGFVDLMYFFCGVLMTQLMQITPLLGFVGTGFSYFLVILRSYLDTPLKRSQSQPPPQVAIDMEEEGSNQNQTAIAPVYSFAALRSASLRYRSSTRRAPSLRTRTSRSASRRSRTRRARALDIHQNQAITEEQANSPSAVDDFSYLIRPDPSVWISEEEEGSNRNQAAIAPVYSFQALPSASLRTRTRHAKALDIPQNQAIAEEEANSHSAVDDISSSMSSHYLSHPDIWVWITPRTRVDLGGDWIRTNQARVLEIFQDCQRSSWNKLLNNLQNRRNDELLIGIMIDKHNLFSVQFKNMCYLISNWLVSDKQLRDHLKTSLENILLPTYDYFKHSNRFLALLDEKYELPDILAELGRLFGGPDILPELLHLLGGTGEMDRLLGEKGKKLAIKNFKLE